MKKWIRIVLTAGAITLFSAGTALAGWNQDGNGWWYTYADGSYPSAGLAGIEGNTYFFDSQGYMQTGWQYINYRWYYFDGSGIRAEGWRQLDGSWYYFSPQMDGMMHTGWLDLDGERYYFDSNGKMQTGIFYLEDGDSGSKYAYQAGTNGALIRNTTAKQGSVKVKYDAMGRITFRNSKTEEDHKRYGTDVWQPLLSQSQLDEEADTADSEKRVIQNELWDSYDENVKRAKKSEREYALAEWKEEVRSELSGYMSSGEIEQFIDQVTGKKG